MTFFGRPAGWLSFFNVFCWPVFHFFWSPCGLVGVSVCGSIVVDAAVASLGAFSGEQPSFVQFSLVF